MRAKLQLPLLFALKLTPLSTGRQVPCAARPWHWTNPKKKSCETAERAREPELVLTKII